MDVLMLNQGMARPEQACESDLPPPRALCLYLFGSPRVSWGHEDQTIPRRQVRATLYYLALRERPVSAEHLRFLLWPDTSDRSARRQLSHLLTHLRRALPHADILEQRGSTVALASHRTWSDVSAFRRVVFHPASSRDPSLLRKACDLYHGSLLDGVSLPSAEFEHEVESERRELEGLFLTAVRSLIDEEMARGNRDAVIAYGQRYLSVDELAEDIHCLLTGLYADMGRPTEALRQCSRLTEALDRELSVCSPAEAMALRQDVLDTGLPRPPESSETGELWLPGDDLPLLGRREALARVGRAVEHVRCSGGGTVLVSGETGIGKTRLLRECASLADDATLILAGSCYPGSQALPFHPLIQMWRQLADLMSAEPANRRLAPGLQAPPPLSRVWPLSRAGWAQPAEVLDATDPAFGRVLGDLVLELGAGPRTVVLCLDDLQWADDATLEWLGLLTSRIGERHLLVLGTYCCTAQGKLRSLLGGWSGSADFFGEVRLAGLGSRETFRLMQLMSGKRSQDALLARQLHRETGGNLYYLVEEIRDLMRHHRSDGSSVVGTDLPVPDTLWKAVMERLSHLTPAARRTLDTAAPLGRWFTAEQALGATLLSGRQATETLDELVQRQVLLQKGPWYRFHHDLIRRVVRTSLDPRPRFALQPRPTRPVRKLAGTV